MLTILPLARVYNAESSTIDHNVLAVVQHAQRLRLHYLGLWYRGSVREVDREGGEERMSLRNPPTLPTLLWHNGSADSRLLLQTLQPWQYIAIK